MAQNFIPIPKCKEGDVSLVSASYANQVIDLLNQLGLIAINPIANVGNIKAAAPGFILDLSVLDGRVKALETRTGISNATVSINLPFAITQFNATAFNVQPGLVHNLNVVGTNTAISISGNSISNVYLNVTIDNNGVATNAVLQNTTSSIPNNTLYQAYKWLGAVQGASGNVGTITQYTVYSQEFAACNRNVAANQNGDYRFFVD